MNQPATYRYSILEIGGHNIGVEVFSVKEVLPCPKITAMPNVHRAILGVFNLRGQIYSLIDIGSLFMLKDQQKVTENFVVILEHEGISFGIKVDKVMDVLVIDSEKIQIPSREDPVELVQYSNGVVKHEVISDIYLLDIPVLMNAKEISQYRF